MVDPISLTVALAALAAGLIAAYGVWVQRGQLRAAEGQLAAAEAQLKTEKAKVETLGKLVDALKGMLDSQAVLATAQAEQIRTLQGAVAELAKGNAIREAQLELQRQDAAVRAAQLTIAQQDAAVRAAQLRWDQTSPLDKAAAFIDEHVDRARDKIRRFFGGR